MGTTAAQRSMTRAGTHHISLSAAHPAKFSEVAILALKDNAGFNFEEQVLPDELKALSQKATRVTKVDNSWKEMREIIKGLAEEGLESRSKRLIEVIFVLCRRL